jgi:hypothetical protein
MNTFLRRVAAKWVRWSDRFRLVLATFYRRKFVAVKQRILAEQAEIESGHDWAWGSATT